MQPATFGPALFAVIFVVLGIRALITRDFPPIFDPVPSWLPARHLFVYLTALVSLLSGAALLTRRASPHAARILLAYLVLWLLAFRVPPILRAPMSIVPWDGCAETLGVVAGAWVLYAGFAPSSDRRRLPFATGDRGIRLARMLYGLALVPFGLAHFAFIKETASLVPTWLPAHMAWAYATGGAFVASALGILAGVCARLAAALSAFEIGGFTLLVWVPVVLAGANAFQWSEFAISSALTAAGWVVAGSYRGTPWLALRAR